MSSTLDPSFLEKLSNICPILQDDSSRLAYARDLWPLGHIHAGDGRPEALSKRPHAIACPRLESEIVEIVKLANAFKIPIIPFGEGSGVCGGTLAQRGGITIDMKQLRRIEKIDRKSLTITVQAGINGHLLEQALEREGLTLGHSPSSILCSTLGGWLATRSAGQFSTYYGKIEDMIISLRAILPSGQLIETTTTPAAAAGPDWNQVIIGSEGTLGIITSATLRVHRLPPAMRFLSFKVPSVEAGFEVIRETLQRGLRPAAVRLYDPLDTLLVGEGKDHQPIPSDHAGAALETSKGLLSLESIEKTLFSKLPKLADTIGKQAALSRPSIVNKCVDLLPKTCLLIMSYEGLPAVVDVMTEETKRVALSFAGCRDNGPKAAETWWRNRHSVSFKQSHVFSMGAFSDTMEVATTWDRLEDLYHHVRKTLSPHAVVLAHFSHAYHEGCSIYFSLAARCPDPQSAIERYQTLWREGLAAVVERGAAVSHHHGIGLLKAAALKESLGPLHHTFQAVKDALDPNNVMNPGKLGLA